MTFTFTDFNKAKSKAKSKKNCKKGMPCGFGCISKTKKCKKQISGGGGGYADHLSDPANLEKGAENSDLDLEIIDTEVELIPEFDVDKEFELDKNLNPVGKTPEIQKELDDLKEWESEESPKAPEDGFAKRLNKDAPPPTEAQAEAIRTYTGGDYDDINGLLRGKKDFADPEYKQQVQDIADKAAEGLRSLPDYEGKTFRGTMLDNDLFDYMEVGSTYSDKGFFSTTSNPSIAKNFSGYNKEEGKTPTIFTVNGKYGKNISNASKHEYEKEILFNPSSKFKITSVTAKNGVVYVDLDQYGKEP